MPRPLHNQDALITPKFRLILDKLKDQKIIETPLTVRLKHQHEFLEKVGRPAFPVILKRGNFAASSPQDSLEHLVNECGELCCMVRCGDYANPRTFSDREFHEMKLREFLDQCESMKICDVGYAGRIQLPDEMNVRLIGATSDILVQDECLLPNAWIGPATSITPLHKDGSDNFIFQVVGVKAWVLFPVKCALSLDMFCPAPDTSSDFWVSRFDARRPSGAFTSVPSLSVCTNPGDVLYIPAGWSHYVCSVTFSVSVNLWRRPELTPFALL